ncbi:farnesyl cysteine-carboxyl methyltransferase [Marasmius crinis-equi]|uniref:Protein-S-isoprenylcysteine O-methyltransferase n=1 Tax=Marasmius crinis-equi TaxID=585013 RepID=A0ABR3F0Y3_9AGAR
MSTTPQDGLEERLRMREQKLNHPLHTQPDADTVIHGNIPNTPLAASTISFILGSLFSLSLLVFLSGGFPQYSWATYQLGFFLAAWSAFHWGEYAVTAGWNLEKCSVDSFLLDNGYMYHVANGSAVIEYLITVYFKPSLKSNPYLSQIGILMVVIGQFLRSIAMIHASTNFSHSVAYRKRNTHRLVTDGVYSYFRHPSYAGFYYWALGTQLVLQNPVCFVGYSYVLWRFFYYRTRSEENALIKFFGNEYVDYRRRVRTWIPFVP